MTKIRTSITAAISLVVSVMMTSAHAQYSDNVIKIGFITDMTGLYAAHDGPGGAEAIRMAIADAGGVINGKKVELVVADHQNKADIAASTAREWFDKQGVDMLIGGTNSSAALAMAKIAAEKKKLFIAVGAGSPQLTNEQCSPYTIHYAYNTYALARSTAKAIMEQGGKDWFFVTVDYAFGHSQEEAASAVVTENGGVIRGSVRHPLNASDFSSYMLRANASGAKVIGLANGGADTINSLKAAQEFGISETMKMAALQINIGDIKSLGLDLAQGMYLTDGWYWDRDEDTRAFANRFNEKMKFIPSMLQAADYSAANQYLLALKSVGTDDTDKVMSYLKNSHINDMFVKNGVVRNDGRMAYDMYLYQVKTPKESQYPWDFLKVVKKIPSDEAFGLFADSKCQFSKL